MAISPAYSVRSPIKNAPGIKPKSLSILNNSKPATSPLKQPDPKSNADSGLDLSEQLNDETRQRYVKGKKLGEGTYAIVYKGHVRDNPSQLVAIKKIKVNAEYKDGLSMDAIREVKYLQELSHPNIIALHSVYSSKNQNLNLVLEFLPLGDLEMLIRDTNGVRYGTADVKAWMGMLGRAVWFCHENFILHRDIKPNNLLIADDGTVKLADFGLARSFADPYLPMTHNVITRWYRPPELFFKARHYSGAVDIWSMGAVFAELIIRTPFMPGNTDIHQVDLISQAIGSPTEENWPGVSSLEGFVPVAKDKIIPLRDRNYFSGLFGTAGPLGVDLLMSMLHLDPRKRVTARQVLQHAWWRNEPRPSRIEDLPKKRSEGEAKMGEDLKRRGGELEAGASGAGGVGGGVGKADKVARKLDFSTTKK